MEIDKSFLGSGWSFPPEFNKYSKAVQMVSAEDDIRESLRILLSTTPGERVMQHAYGCRLNTLVFEPITESTITEIKDVIERAVLFFEPRITLENIRVNTEKANEGLIQVQLDYKIRTTNSRSNMVYPFYFKEGTNLFF